MNPQKQAPSSQPPKPVPHGRITKLEAPVVPMSFDQWRNVIATHFPEMTNPAEVCLSVMAQLLLRDVANPFALALVDVPSSGKTITLNFFSGLKEIAYASDNFTPASFVSHASNVKKEDLDSVDLLPRIRYKTLIVRELGSILNANDDDLRKIMGLLTRVLDGEGLITDGGVHGRRGYQGDYVFMMLAATTPVAPRALKIMGNFGSRLFFLQLRTKDKSDDELIGQNGKDRKVSEDICKAATSQYLKTLWAANPKGIVWDKTKDPRDCKLVIARCARLLAGLRGAINIYVSEDGTLSHTMPTIEKPDRINCVFYNLARGHAVACGRRQITREDLWPVLDLTFDSAPNTRAKVFRHLIEAGGTLSTSDVEGLLNCSAPTARKELEALTISKVTTKTEGIPTHAGRPEAVITLKPEFEWFLSEEAKVLMEATHPQVGNPFFIPDTQQEIIKKANLSSVCVEAPKEADGPFLSAKLDAMTDADYDAYQEAVTLSADGKWGDNGALYAAHKAEERREREAGQQESEAEINVNYAGFFKKHGFADNAEYEAWFAKSKTVFPGDWLHFSDASDFIQFTERAYPLPTTCVGLSNSPAKEQLEAVLDGSLDCGRKLDGPFYWHRTRHVARCEDCQQASWAAQDYDVFDGFPFGDWNVTQEVRSAEVKRNNMQKDRLYAIKHEAQGYGEGYDAEIDRLDAIVGDRIRQPDGTRVKVRPDDFVEI